MKTHPHDPNKCALCRKLMALAQLNVVPTEKIVYRVPALVKGTLAGFAGGWCVLLWGLWTVERQPDPIPRPYAVTVTKYKTDPKMVKDFEDCQNDWRADQVEKELLRMKIKRLQMP